MEKIDLHKHIMKRGWVDFVVTGAVALLEKDIQEKFGANYRGRVEEKMEITLVVNGFELPFLEFIEGMEKRIDDLVNKKAEELVNFKFDPIIEQINEAKEDFVNTLKAKIWK